MSRKIKKSSKQSSDEFFGSYSVEPGGEVRELSVEELDELNMLLER